MGYFQFLPQIKYFTRTAPDIFTRAVLTGNDVFNMAVYHPYTIVDGDRPDTIAFFYYGDSQLDWLVRLANNIFDEVSQWPLTTNQFVIYMTNKYGALNPTYSTIDHYELVLNPEPVNSAEYIDLAAPAQKYWAWNAYLNQYIFVASQYTPSITVEAYESMIGAEQLYWTGISQYDTELAINEAKRNIRLIDRQYTTNLQSALQTIMTGS